MCAALVVWLLLRFSRRVFARLAAAGHRYLPLIGESATALALFGSHGLRGRVSGSATLTGSVTSLLLSSSKQDPADDEHDRSPDQEAQVPVDPLLAWHRLVDMMDREQMVVDDPLR